eukprot:7373921-Prymnesium_polylepis.1
MVTLSTILGATDRESNREGGRRASSANSDADGAAATGGNQLLLMLHASLVEPLPEAEGPPPAGREAQGLRLVDSLCDIKELAELVADNAETALLDPTISARSLFAIADDTITLDPQQFTQPQSEAAGVPNVEGADDAEPAAENGLVPVEAAHGEALLERLLA